MGSRRARGAVCREPHRRAAIRQHELVYEDGTECNGDAVYKADVVLTTYEMVQADRSTLSKVPWSCLVVDEAHRLKNSGGRAVRDLHTLDFAQGCALPRGTQCCRTTRPSSGPS